MRRVQRRILKGAATLVVLAGILVLFGLGVMWLWNTLVPPLFHGPQLTYLQALGLLALCRLLVGGLRGRHGGAHRRHWQRHWEQLTPEERAQLRARLAGRCGRGRPRLSSRASMARTPRPQYRRRMIPQTMTAVEITAPGGPEVLRAGSRPVPQPGRGEVLMRVASAGVNRPDTLQRKGVYPPPKGVTDIPGLEVSGEVVQLGEGVQQPALGSQVCALVAGGGYAQYAAVPALQCLPVPVSLTLEEAGALPETFFTVWYNIFQRAALVRGETLLVHGGSGGIGTTAIMLARAFGVRVLATAGSAAKCAACRELGAELAINYHDTDFVAATLEVTGGRGADVILDMVGGSYLARNVSAAATDGRIALIAIQGGSQAELDLRPVMTKRLVITASTLRPQSPERKGRIAAALQREVWPLFATHNLRPPIHERFPLAEAARAHQLMESGEHIGKIVLQVS
jgi:NADPH:quinone reductase